VQENAITEALIGCAIEVPRELGSGLIEKAYEESLCHEMHLHGLQFERQKAVPLTYKGVKLSVNLWLDLLIEQRVILDLKAKEQVTPLDKIKVLTYLRLCNLRVGLIINFHVERLTDSITRVVNRFIEPDGPSSVPDLRA
jgi:GxxExxY protein